ncbi:hypothetical protein QYM36_017561 [Artemia franciscana]|uniref:Uncharacterized protein n=1 Tax=Artemia franciscana TaxID=6661 RepID=A0AA88HF38_ARTSF|nr:hypothetical protein QYM36_017561 [Artemia franciscana]
MRPWYITEPEIEASSERILSDLTIVAVSNRTSSPIFNSANSIPHIFIDQFINNMETTTLPIPKSNINAGDPAKRNQDDDNSPRPTKRRKKGKHLARKVALAVIFPVVFLIALEIIRRNKLSK